MDCIELIKQYVQEASKGYSILVEHSLAVSAKAVAIAERLKLTNDQIIFINEAALLHDIGVIYANAPDIGFNGKEPYICHGYKGRELVEQLGYPKHALVCERHTGVGLTKLDIINQNLPIPHRDMLPISLEEEIICFADKFFSKSGNLKKEKSVEKIRKQLSRYGDKHVVKFNDWCIRFL